jgi:uncharacterized membrane protein YkvA (DUF1232 family)
MLHAFKAQLKNLSEDPRDPFHLKVRRRVGKRATLLLEKRLRQLILITPDMIQRVYLLWRQFPEDAPARRVSGYLLTYLYHPQDFLPEDCHGLFGYLDDAYFAALVYEYVLGAVEGTGYSPTALDKRFVKDIANMKASAKLVISDEALKIEAMFHEIQKSDQSALFASAFTTREME